MDAERAGNWLRLMAEAELRRAQALPRTPKPGPHDQGSGWACLARLRYAASALTAVGAIGAEEADAVVEDLNLALVVRQRVGQRRLPGQARAAIRRLLASRAPVPLSPSMPHGSGAGQAGPARVVPVGRRLVIGDQNVTADVCLTSLIRIGDRALFAVSGQPINWPRRAPFYLPSDNLQADDDLGNTYRLLFTGGFGEGRIDGWLTVRSGLPPGARWLELHSGPGTARLRVDLTAAATAAEVRSGPAGPASPGERLLDSLAGGILAALPDGDGSPAGLDETVAALEDTGLLPPGSPATTRMAELCRQAGIGVAPRLVAALQTGNMPPADLPEAWTSVLAHSRRRNRPAGKLGVAPIATALPECGGVRFIVTGLESQQDRATLTGVALGLSFDHLHRLDCLCWTRWFPWWIRDNTGQWHVAAPEGHYGVDGEPATFGLRVVPPLAQTVTGLDVIITGPAHRIQARLPVAWVGADE